MIELGISRNVVPLCGKCGKALECRTEDDNPHDAESNILVYVEPCTCTGQIAPKDTIHVGEEDDRGKSKLVVCCNGVSYEGLAFRGGKMVCFPTDVPERVSEIVFEYFREPVGEVNWELLA